MQLVDVAGPGEPQLPPPVTLPQCQPSPQHGGTARGGRTLALGGLCTPPSQPSRQVRNGEINSLISLIFPFFLCINFHVILLFPLFLYFSFSFFSSSFHVLISVSPFITIFPSLCFPSGGDRRFRSYCCVTCRWGRRSRRRSTQGRRRLWWKGLSCPVHGSTRPRLRGHGLWACTYWCVRVCGCVGVGRDKRE